MPKKERTVKLLKSKFTELVMKDHQENTLNKHQKLPNKRLRKEMINKEKGQRDQRLPVAMH